MEYLLHSSTDGRKGPGESPRGNEYQKEIDDLMRLVGDQALVIDALKKVDQGGNDDGCEYSQERNAVIYLVS